jgi:hypothetical protein
VHACHVHRGCIMSFGIMSLQEFFLIQLCHISILRPSSILSQSHPETFRLLISVNRNLFKNSSNQPPSTPMRSNPSMPKPAYIITSGTTSKTSVFSPTFLSTQYTSLLPPKEILQARFRTSPKKMALFQSKPCPYRQTEIETI